MKVTAKRIKETKNEWLKVSEAFMCVYGESLENYSRYCDLFHYIDNNTCYIEMEAFEKIDLRTDYGFIECIGTLRSDLKPLMGWKNEINIDIK